MDNVNNKSFKENMRIAVRILPYIAVLTLCIFPLSLLIVLVIYLKKIIGI